MIGDSLNVLSRLKSLLPARWFSDDAPVADMAMGGVADGLAESYSLYVYAKAQTRIATATSFWLDLIAFDFFGLRFRRRASQGDDSFRMAVSKEIFRVRATRPGMSQAIFDLTGVEPIIFEPSNPKDTGAYGTGTMGYSTAGRYGSIALINQVYMDVQRPLGQGVPLIAGYGSGAGGYGTQANTGRSEYVGVDMIRGPVTDLDIYGVVDAVRAAGTTVWTRISDSLPPPDISPSYQSLLTPGGDFLVMPDGGHIFASGPT